MQDASPLDGYMLLETILFGTWTPPEVTKTISHRIGMCGGNRYTPSSKRVYKTEDGLNASEHLIMEMMRRYCKHLGAADMAPIVDMTTNHCGMTLAGLYKKKLLKRYKVRKNGTSLFMYCLKEDDEAFNR